MDYEFNINYEGKTDVSVCQWRHLLTNWLVRQWDSVRKGMTCSQYRSYLLICWRTWWKEKLVEDKTRMSMKHFLSEWVHISVSINHWHQNQHTQPSNIFLIPKVHKGTSRPLAPIQTTKVSSFLVWEPGFKLLWNADSLIILPRFHAVGQPNTSPFIKYVDFQWTLLP